MSYRNPKQFLDSTANPFAEGLDKAFDNMKVEIEEDRIEQEKIQKRVSEPLRRKIQHDVEKIFSHNISAKSTN